MLRGAKRPLGGGGRAGGGGNRWKSEQQEHHRPPPPPFPVPESPPPVPILRPAIANQQRGGKVRLSSFLCSIEASFTMIASNLVIFCASSKRSRVAIFVPAVSLTPSKLKDIFSFLISLGENNFRAGVPPLMCRTASSVSLTSPGTRGRECGLARIWDLGISRFADLNSGLRFKILAF